MAAVVVVTASGSAYLGGWNWPSGIVRAANGHHVFRNSSGHPAHPAFREPELDAVLRTSGGRPALPSLSSLAQCFVSQADLLQDWTKSSHKRIARRPGKREDWFDSRCLYID